MNIVITMAGMGTRFSNVGYDVPKFQIMARGKTLFEWSLSSLAGFHMHDNRYIFIVREEDQAEDFIREKCAVLGIRHYHIVRLAHITDGQATTAMFANQYWDLQAPLLVYNIDTYVEENEMKVSDISGDGFIPCFKAFGNHWSFVKLDKVGNVLEVREKERISDNCTIGAYYFKSCALYVDLYNMYYKSSSKSQKEKYIAPLYNELIARGGVVKIYLVDSQKVHPLGTPEELELFSAITNAL